MTHTEQSGKILIVDDEKIVHDSLRCLLEDQSYIIESAYNGMDAKKMISELKA